MVFSEENLSKLTGNVLENIINYASKLLENFTYFSE